jgi:hypothetical protein
MEMERQPCAACGIDRRVIHREWLPSGYEIQSLECPGCRTVMRLVRKRPSVRERLDSRTRSCVGP